MIVLYLVLGLILFYLFNLIVKRSVLFYKLSWIPGPPALPIIGNISSTPEGAFKNMVNYYKKYGKTYKLWLGSTPIVQCQDIEIIQAVFKQDDKTCRPPLYVLIRGYLGPGLLFGEADDKWKVHRKYLSESFHTDIIEEGIQLTIKKIHQLISIFDKAIKPNKPIDLIELTKPCFLDVSLGTIAKVDSDSLAKPECFPYLQAIERMSELVMARMFSPLMKHSFIFSLSQLKGIHNDTVKNIQQFIKTVVSKRRSVILSKSPIAGAKRNIADAMLAMENTNDTFTTYYVESQVSNNILASFDTLATVTSYFLFIIGNHPKIQDDLLKEINSIAPRILEEGISLKDINNLKLFDRCVKETLRMFPPAPLIGRHLLQSFTTKHGILPAGIDMYINMYNYHRNEQVFLNPDKFDPDRFLPENSSKRHPLSWIPFGFGSRSCIGQKIALVQCKVAVAMLIKKYSVTSFEGLEDLKLSANLVLKSRDGIRVYLQPRE